MFHVKSCKCDLTYHEFLPFWLVVKAATQCLEEHGFNSFWDPIFSFLVLMLMTELNRLFTLMFEKHHDLS